MTTFDLIRRAQDAGVQLRLVDGKVKVIGKRSAVDALIEPLREHKDDLVRWLTSAPNDPEPPANPADWRELAAEYHKHHFGCAACKSAGQGYGLRCGLGSALWVNYQTTATSKN